MFQLLLACHKLTGAIVAISVCDGKIGNPVCPFLLVGFDNTSMESQAFTSSFYCLDVVLPVGNAQRALFDQDVANAENWLIRS